MMTFVFNLFHDFICLSIIHNQWIHSTYFFFWETKIHSPAMINAHHPGLAGSAEAAGEATSEEVGHRKHGPVANGESSEHSRENGGKMIGKSWGICGKNFGKGWKPCTHGK